MTVGRRCLQKHHRLAQLVISKKAMWIPRYRKGVEKAIEEAGLQHVQ